MKKWFKPQLLVMLLAVLIALPFWWAGSTTYAATESIASGTVPWNNAKGDGASTPFQMADISSFLSGTLACPNMSQSVFNHGTPTLQIWLIEDSHAGRLDASGETHCTQAQTPWSLAAGQNPAGRYHLWVNCHWGGCGHDVKVSYSVDTKPAAPVVPKPAAPVGNTLTADQLLNQTLNNQTPKLAQAYAVHAGWATSASPGTDSFPSSSVQSKIAADALIACTNPAGTLRMSLKISPTSSLNPNKVLNSTTLSCQSGSGHTDDLSVSTDAGFIVTFDNAINTGNWAVKYVASADKPLPTPPNKPLPAPPSGGDTPPSQQTPYDYCALGYNLAFIGDASIICTQGSKTGFDLCVRGYTHAKHLTYTLEAEYECATYPIALQRSWNPTNGDHLYTTSASETSDAHNKYGYTYEKIAAYVFNSYVANSTPLYRLVGQKGDHFYTTSVSEGKYAQSKGYTDEEIACYVYSTQVGNSVPLYRFWNSKTGDHFYTTSISEGKYAQSKGYTYEEIAAYVVPV